LVKVLMRFYYNINNMLEIKTKEIKNINRKVLNKKRHFISALIVFSLFFTASFALASDKYWVGRVSELTSNKANWSDTSGGSSTNRLPSFDDVIIFDAGSISNAYFDADMDVWQMDIQSGFTYNIDYGPLATVDVDDPNSTPIIYISKTGHQLATTTLGVADFDIGGAFTIEAEGNATITSIKLKQIGSLATSSLSDIELSYQTSVDTTCSDTKPVGTTVFAAESDFDSDNAVTLTGSMSLSTGSFTCLYITYDLTGTYSTSTVGRSIDFEITNPSTDVIVTGAVTTASNPVNILRRTIVVSEVTEPENPEAPNLDITSLISLRVKDPAKNPTVFYLQNKAIWKMEGGGTPVRLTNPNLQVHSFSLTDLSPDNAEGAVRIQMTTSNMDPAAESNFLNITRTKSITATVKAWGGLGD
jgi:hypothetical protein